MSEKTEKPTAKRLRESRKKGQLARSKLFSSAAVTLGGLVGATAGAPAATVRLQAWTASLLLRQDVAPTAAMVEGGRVVIAFVAPCLLGAFGVSLALSLAVAGFQFEPSHVAPQLERISPAKGLGQMFQASKLVELGKGLLVVAILGAVVLSEARATGPALFRAVGHEGETGLRVGLLALQSLAMRCAGVLALLGCGDYLLARRRHLNTLMMTRDEVKREHKESEGDPRLKSKRRSLQRQMAAGGAARGVQKATAVVVNPTHIAVALRYAPDECEVPYLVAKGREGDALALRREAERLEIPVIRDVPLARSLVHYDVGEEIPEELYQAAAVILQVALESRDRDASPGRRTV